MRFEFATAARIVFGQGVIAELPSLAKGFGKRALVVTGKDKIRRAGIVGELEATGFACSLFGVPGEPTVTLVREGAELLRASGSNVVIAIGGGSAIDAAKAIAAIAPNPGDVLDYLEVVGQGRPLPNAPVAVIAVPTTAGTGSEVTRNAVLGSPEHGVKASLRSPLMLPGIALVDPELTLGLPRGITASTGLDALTQLIEPFVCIRANPLTDAFCRDGLARAARSLPRACADGRDAEARTGMSYASLLGGLSLANAGLGVVHGFAAPIGGMFDAPHGAVCAALLAHGMAGNIRALRLRAPESAALIRYGEIAAILTGNAGATPQEGVEWVRQLVRELNIPPLRDYGIKESDISELAEKAERASSMKANPLPLTRDELASILDAAL
ncbi:MAG: iron-containing alcohol dehydrogenase [Acidobacteriota bacterium]